MTIKITNYKNYKCKKRMFFNPKIEKKVKKILNQVKKQGDIAVKKYTLMFDKADIKDIKINPEQIKDASSKIKNKYLDAIKSISDKIFEFAKKQKKQLSDFKFEIRPGVFTGQKIIPIESAGIYVPGGKYPLVSSLLMGAIPAKVAGVEKISIVSPPTYKNSIHPAILAAANIIGVNDIYQVGGVQAIGALAFGTKSIESVNKIVGPGNDYVTAAKKMVYGLVGIDFIAGPTEVFIIADETANPEIIAADLLAQAEHDENAESILTVNSKELASKVVQEIEKQLLQLDTSKTARRSLNNNGIIILVDNISQAIELANKKAPEHLEIQTKNPEKFINDLRNYGSLFMGKNSAEVFGDYSSGINHTLPTGGAAKYTGGLSVLDFLKVQTILEVQNSGIKNLAEAKIMSELEGLSGHLSSAKKRDSS